MKPIKTLLSFCVVLLVTMGAWGQVTGITAPTVTAGQQCVGATVTPSSAAPTVTATGCGAEAVFLQLIDGGGNELAFGAAGSVTAPAVGSVVIPTSAAGLTVYYRYITRGTLSGCGPFNGTATPLNNNTVAPNLSAPTLTNPIPAICDGGTQLTEAQLEVNGAYASCVTGTLNLISVAGTPPWNTAGTYTATFRCDNGTCTSPTKETTFTVNAIPVAPQLGSTNIPAICNGATQLTIAQLEVNGTYASCAGSSTLKVQNGAPSNTASGQVVFACEKDGCKSATLSVNYTVNLVVAAPTGVAITSDRAGATGNGTTAVSVCPSSLPTPGTLAFAGACGTNDYVIKNGATVVAVNTASIAAPTATTTYTVVCRDAMGCESPTGVNVTYTVTAATPAPTLGSAIPAICAGATQLTQAQLEVNGVYANCTTGTLKLVSVLGTAPWNTAGTYTATWRCEESANCFSSNVSTNFTVNALPVAPTLGSSNIPAICNGATQLTVAQLEVNGTYAACASGSTLKVQNGAPSNTVSGQVVYACENNTTGCKSATLSVNYTVNIVVAAPTGVTLSTNRAGATGNGTTAVVACATADPNPGTLTFGGACGGNDYVIMKGATVVAVNTASIAAPTATTTYTVVCRDALGCVSPTGVDVTYTITTTLPKPTLATAIPAICAGATQLTQAQLEVNGVYANCATGTLKLVSVLGTAPWNTAGTYTATFACQQGGCNSEGVSTNFTVNALPVAPTLGSSNIPAICNGATQLTVAQLEVNGTYAACASGSTLKVQNGAPSNTVSGQVVYACENNTTGCKSATLSVSYTVNLVVAAPTGVNITSNRAGATGNGTTAVSVCPSSLPTPGTLAFAGACGTNDYVIMKGATVVAVNTASITAPTATTTYTVVCRDALGCVSPTGVDVTYTVTAATPAPTLVAPIPAICHLATQLTAAQLEVNGVYANCTTGTLKLVSVAGTAPWNTAGTYTATWRCEESANCFSSTVSRDFIVKSPLATPTAVSAVSSTICQGSPAQFNVTHSCGSTATIEIYKDGALVGSQLAGSAMPTVVTVANAAAGTYAAKCMLDGCYSSLSSATASIAVESTPATPTFTGPTALQPNSICLANPTVPMQNTLTCGTNTQVLVWYDAATGGNVIPTPNVTPTVTTTYYVSCKSLTGTLGCEGSRLAVTFTAYPAGSNPTAASLTAAGTTVNVGQDKVICSTTGTAITFSGCASGETLLVSVDGNAYSATLPTVVTDGVKHNYRVRCQAGSGASACNGPESGVMSLTAYPVLTTAPSASVVPAVVCSSGGAVPFGGSSTCGALATVWFDATTNTQLLSLPSMTPTTPGTYSYYAKCVNGGGCMSPASATTSLTVVGNSAAPVITVVGGNEVCTGVNVTLTTNCASGSTVVWSTGVTGNALPLVSNVPQVRAVTAKCVTTVGSTTCESPASATTTVVWKAFDITLINIGSSQSGVKPGSNVAKSAWAANFVTVDAGPSLQSSSQSNPSIYFTENPNKGAPRYWTAHVETCALGTAGSISYDLLCTPEVGVPQSFNTVENNAPYLMYANRDNFTELYAQNHPAFGFFADNGSGGNKYDAGLPKGLYKMSIRYWDQKGAGLYPAVRTAQGNQLAYQEYWFRIQSQNGIGTGAAREGVSENTEAPFVTMGQNPVTRTLSLTINGAKGQEVKLNLVDASGRSIKASSVTPETNTHREEIDMTSQNTGMYFIQVSTPSKRASLKVLKVSQD